MEKKTRYNSLDVKILNKIKYNKIKGNIYNKQEFLQSSKTLHNLN